MQLPKFGTDGALYIVALGLLLLVGCSQCGVVKDPPAGQALDVGRVIGELRNQLDKMDTSRRAEGKEALLSVEEATVTLSFVANQSESGKAGVEFQILTAGAAKSVATEAVQTITVKLKPFRVIDHKLPSSPPGDSGESK